MGKSCLKHLKIHAWPVSVVRARGTLPGDTDAELYGLGGKVICVPGMYVILSMGGVLVPPG